MWGNNAKEEMYGRSYEILYYQLIYVCMYFVILDYLQKNQRFDHLRKDELLRDSYCEKYMHIGFGPMVDIRKQRTKNPNGEWCVVLFLLYLISI